MIKALLLIFEPAETWDAIVRARRGIVFLLLIYLLPMVIIPSAIEGYGLVRFGEWQTIGELKNLRHFHASEAIAVEAVQSLLLLLVVFLSAHVIRSMGDTFHGRHSFGQAFTVVVYALGPFLLLRVFDALTIDPSIPWIVGILLSMGIMYHGVPRVMEPDPSHAFGLYLTSWFLLFLLSGVWRALTWAYLKGYMPEVQRWVEKMV